MKNKNINIEEPLDESQVVKTKEFDSLSNEQQEFEEPLSSPRVMSESSSGAVLKELSKHDNDRPDLGLFQWLVIAALIFKKVGLICLLIVLICWMFY